MLKKFLLLNYSKRKEVLAVRRTQAQAYAICRKKLPGLRTQKEVLARALFLGCTVRSFLGLANYNARLIPDFATVAEPLRRLTKKGAIMDKNRERHLLSLKEGFKCRNPGYFDKDAKSLIIADAIPVGPICQ